eukprot:11118016-Alexandrium_andersonii.AAC.1
MERGFQRPEGARASVCDERAVVASDLPAGAPDSGRGREFELPRDGPELRLGHDGARAGIHFAGAEENKVRRQGLPRRQPSPGRLFHCLTTLWGGRGTWRRNSGV